MKKFSLSTLCLTALLGLVLVGPGQGQLPTRVKDILAGAGGSEPNDLTAVGNTLYFTATDEVNGRELWKSDGTEAGTVLVKDIRPGSDDSDLDDLTAVGGTLYFRADDGTNGGELWKSDGTGAGTVLVKDIWPGADGSGISYLTAIGSTLYFSADDGTNGSELWKSDGTEAGTVLVKDIWPGINTDDPSFPFVNSSDPRSLTAFNGALYFSADDGTTGRELWKSDGTEAGTVLVKDIYPGSDGSFPNSSFPGNLTALGNTLYFSANDGTNGGELYKSDGTEAGTVLVKDINPTGGSGITNTAVAGSTLYFSANDGTTGRELWKSDGTEAGTVLVKDIAPGSSGSFPVEMEALGSTLYFRVEGLMFYKSDGTEAGTVLVKDLDPTSNLGGDPRDLAAFNGLIYFNGDDGTLGDELWKSDGTEAGTVLVADINPGSGGSAPEKKAVVGNTLYFSANDGTTGQELWKLDAPAPPPCDARVALYPATPSKICQGQSLPVTFSTVGSCPDPAPNTFLVQLSSATGSFANPTNLGSAAPGTTALPLPTNLPVGTGYRVRILSGNPATPSSASVPFRVEGPSLSLTPGMAGAPVCRGSAVTVSFTLPVGSCPFPEGNAFTAQLSSASGSFASPVSLGTVLPGVSNAVSIPAGVAAGTGYRIRLVSSNPVLTSQASIPFRVNACASRLSAEEAQLVVAPNPAVGGEIRLRVSGMDNPQFSLTAFSGLSLSVSVKTDGSGDFVLTPKQTLTPGLYAVQATEGPTRLTRRVLVGE